MYKLSLDMMGTLYEGEGETMLEALRNLPQPPKIMYKGKLTIKKDDNVRQNILYMPPRLKRLFHTSQSAKVVIAKQLETGLVKSL